MNQILRFAIFLSIVLGVYFGMHFYIYRRIVGGLSLTGSQSRIVMWVFVVGGCSFILGEIASRRFSFHLPLSFGAIWMGVIAISLAMFLVRDILFLVFRAFHPSLVPATWVTLGVILLISGYSLFNGNRSPRMKEITVPISGFSDALAGMKIVQLSDLHLNGEKPVEKLASIVERANAVKPDLVVITGDLIDRDFETVSMYVPELKKLSATYGIFAIPGNHEFYAGIAHYEALLKASGITELSNRSQMLGDTGVCLAGVPDPTGYQFPPYEPRFEETLSTCDPSKPLLFLSHQPIRFQDAMERGVDLMLSGHTHAGQIPPLDLIVRLVYRYPFGLYSKGNASMYTTCGTGTWGPPMRFLSRSEIVTITLVKKS